METSQEAEAMVNELTARCGCQRSDIGVLTRDSQGGTHGTIGAGDAASGAVKTAGTGAAVGGALGLIAGAASLAIPGFGPVIAAGPLASALTGAGLGAVTGGLIGALTKAGIPEEDARYYEDGVRRGGTLLSVHARNDDTAECAAAVMQTRSRPQSRPTAKADSKVLPAVNEELVVGKREVSRGGVRVYTQVIETPVQETLALREERARVERRPVDRPAGPDVFKEQTIEIRETAEEPVVTKRTRVVEEVVVSKETTQREETIQDTVRKTDVHVEHAAAGEWPDAGEERRTGPAAYSGVERRVAQRRG